MAGYNGKSMSNNAVKAYQHGEMPKSKWTKAAMINAINEHLDTNGLYLNTEIFRLKKSELFDNFFTCSSWHHTGKFYNCTNFYELDESALEEVTQDELAEELADPSEYREVKREKKVIEYSFLDLFRDAPEMFEHDCYENWNGEDELRFIGGDEMLFFYSTRDLKEIDASEYKKAN